MIDLSVILPCYNEASTVGQQLEALASQEWDKSWEIIVVDNRSTDGTDEVVKKYQSHVPNLRFIRAFEHQGKPYALNKAIEVAEGERLAFCDADDVVGTGWIAAIGDALDVHEFVAGRLKPLRKEDNLASKIRWCPQQEGLQEQTYPPYLPHAAGCNLGIKKSLLESVGGFDDEFTYLQDKDLCWRMQLAGTPLQFVPDAVVHYRLRSSVWETYRQAINWGEYNVLLYKKYRSHGMADLTLKSGLKRWWDLVKQIATSIDQYRCIPGYLWHLCWLFGRLKGSIKYRVVAL